MKILRFILPFLFIRNWHTGVWELSKPRCILFGGILFLVLCSVGAAYVLHLPVAYTI